MAESKKVLEVVAAVITRSDFFLCLQRGNHPFPYLSEKFEFPGGKTESGESQEEALIREIREELCLEIRPLRHLISVAHAYPDFSILLHAWLCETEEKEPVLNEHKTACWLPLDRLKEPDWAAADVPVVEFLMERIPPSGQRH
jgi:8-oxo-dGTP diphosphatase